MDHSTFEDVCTKNGFNVESHTVTTPDGDILEVFRLRTDAVKNMPHGEAPVVFMQHGVLSSSFTFIANFEEKAPAFVFARASYDVWLGNNRGNQYSRANTHLDPTTQAE